MRTLLLADLQDITKAGMLYLLEKLHAADSVYEADTKRELLQRLSEHPQAVVILDYTLFDLTGPEDLLNISARYPEAHWLLFSEELSTDFLRNTLLHSDRFGVVFKEGSNEEIQTALSLSLKNERYLCNRASNQLLGKPGRSLDKPDHALTPSEVDILKLIAMGKTNKEIAQERFSSVHTITTHRKNIFRKIGVSSVHEATRYALKAGILDSAEYYI
jgi:DNA-binding NarL/FixJ family response regulator